LKKHPDHGGKKKSIKQLTILYENSVYYRNIGVEGFILEQSREKRRRLRICQEGSFERLDISYL
jgi:hypothetical protein